MTAGGGKIRGFSGLVLMPNDPGYDEARRLWNGMYDRRPALIARCLSTRDVSLALKFATANQLPVSVRGGGHNVAGIAISDGSLVVDLSLMRDVSVDARERLAHADGGCLLRDLDAATTPHGLACPAGVVSHTGLGGLALGGGYGWLSRRWGLTCDHIARAEIVLADGSVVEASSEQNPELLWAIRGGGGNFGVVTRFTLRLQAVGPLVFGTVRYPLDMAAEALRHYRKNATEQPRDLHTVVALRRGPSTSGARLGAPILAVSALWTGEPGQGYRQIEEMLDTPAGGERSLDVVSYFELQAMADRSEPHGRRYFTKSAYLWTVSDEAIDGLLGAAVRNPSPYSAIDLGYLIGAIADGDESTAFPHRDKPYMCTASAAWEETDQDDINTDWSRQTIDSLRSCAADGVYVNYLQAPEEALSAFAFGARHRQLAAVKAAYDPDNVFCSNQNIRPEKLSGSIPRDGRE